MESVLSSQKHYLSLSKNQNYYAARFVIDSTRSCIELLLENYFFDIRLVHIGRTAIGIDGIIGTGGVNGPSPAISNENS
jgi:hypothetical protein